MVGPEDRGRPGKPTLHLGKVTCDQPDCQRMSDTPTNPRAALRVWPLIAVGLVAGIFSTLFGVGGGTVMVPLLVLLLAYDTKVATATSLAAIIVTATVGVISHAQLGHVDWRYALLIGLPAIAGLFLGLWMKARMSVRTLTIWFAVLMVGVAVWMLIEQSAVGGKPALTAMTATVIAVLGVVAGVLAGLFGVGGGIIFVPALALILGMSQKLAIGTSLLAIVPVSLVGSWRQHRAGTVSWSAALIMGAASTVTAWIGAQITDAVSARWLRIGFACLMVFTAWQLAKRARATESTQS